MYNAVLSFFLSALSPSFAGCFFSFHSVAQIQTRYSFAKIIFGSSSLSVLKLSHNCAIPLVARCGCWCKQMPLTEMVSWAGAWAWFPTVPSPSSGPREEDRSYSRPLLSPKPLSRKYLTWGEPWTLISANQVSVWRLTMRNLYTSLR